MRHIKKIWLLIFCIAFSQLDAQVSKEEFIQGQNIPKLNILFPIGDNSKVYYAEISNDKKLLATANFGDDNIMIWDIGSGKLLKKINTSNEGFKWSLKFSPDNKKIIIGYDRAGEMQIIVCDIASEKFFTLAIGSANFVVVPETNEIIVQYETKFVVYSLNNYKLTKEIKNKTGINGYISLSPQRNYLIAFDKFSSNLKYEIFDFKSGKLITEIEQGKDKKTKSAHSFTIDWQPVKFITDNKILINFNNGDFAVYDIRKKKELTHIANPHNSYETLTALSKDGKYLITTTKEDKILKLWDMNCLKDTSVSLRGMILSNILSDICYSCIEADISNICFANDSILNIIFEDRYYGNGVIGININTWSICGMDKLKEYNKQIDLMMKLDPEQEVFGEMGTVINNFLGDVFKISEVDNIIITTDLIGDLRLYSGNYDPNIKQDENRAIQHFKSYVNRSNNLICVKNELYNCSNKEIRSYNLKTGANSTFKSIDPSEEEEVTDSLITFHGESRFIGIEYLKDINCIAIAKHQDFKSKIIFQSLNSQDSSYTFIPEVLEIEDRNIEILELKSSPNGNFIAVFWGYREDKQYIRDLVFTQIFNTKNKKLVTSFFEEDHRDDEGDGYAFSQDEKFIANIQKRGDGIRLFNTLDSSVKYISETETIWDVSFSENNKYLVYNTHGDFGVKTVSIEDFTKSESGSDKLVHKNKSSNYYLSDYQYTVEIHKLEETGNAELAVYFRNYYGGCKLFIPNIDDSLIFIVDNYTIHVWSLNSLKELYTLVGHTNDITNILINEDRTQIVSYSEDQVIKFWDYKTGKYLYSKIDLVNGSVFFDAGYRFDCNAAIRDSIYFVCGTEIIEMDQVKDLCWEPGLVGKILGINKEPIKAKQLEEISICNFSPVIEIIEENKDIKTFKVKRRSGGIGELSVYINQKEIEKIPISTLIFSNDEAIVPIDLKKYSNYYQAGKENSVQLQARTSDLSMGAKGEEIEVSNDDSKPTTAPNLYAIIVGVSDYKGDVLDLKFAAKDALDFSNALQHSAQALLNIDGKEHVFITTLVSGGSLPPSKSNISKAFADVKEKANANDIVVIYLSGHGENYGTETTNFYYLTDDASTFNLAGVEKNVAISTNEFADWLKVIPAGKQVLILDACASGKLANDMAFAMRAAIPSDQIRALDRLNSRTGTFILSGAAANQSAYETSIYGQGLLTYSLLYGMKSGTALKERQFVDVDQLFQYCADKVKELAIGIGGIQEPVISKPNGGASFDIGKVDTTVAAKIILALPKPIFTNSDFSNDDTYADELDLKIAIDNLLNEIASKGKESQLVFTDESQLPESYKILGRYTIVNNKINIKVRVRKGATEIKRFEITNFENDKEKLANAILEQVKILLN